MHHIYIIIIFSNVLFNRRIEIDSRISKEKDNSRIKYPSIDQDCWIDNAPKTVKGERDNNGTNFIFSLVGFK